MGSKGEIPRRPAHVGFSLKARHLLFYEYAPWLGGTKAGRIDRSARDNMVNLTTRETNVRKLAVGKATQLRSQPPAFAPLLKCNPIRFERTVDLPFGGC